MKINFAETEVQDFEPLPSGWYTVAVTDGEIRESGPQSKNPGAEYIHWEYTVQEGQFANRKVWDNTTLLPHALFSLKGLLGAAGFPVDGDLDFEIDDVIGKQVQVKLSQRDADNGNTYNDVKGYKAAGASVGSNSLLPS
jgi:hypothetical protein